MTLQKVVDMATCISSLENAELVIEESGRLLYDPDFEDNLGRSLKDLQITDGKRLLISAESSKGLEYDLIVFIENKPNLKKPKWIGQEKELIKKPKMIEEPKKELQDIDMNEEGDLIL
jgi:hypothetical protein